jgi:hypothetical protein
MKSRPPVPSSPVAENLVSLPVDMVDLLEASVFSRMMTVTMSPTPAAFTSV